MLSDEIVKAYYKYRENALEQLVNLEHLQVVIRIKPNAFLRLRAEGVTFFNNNICHYIELLGRKTPIIIEDDLPKEVEFIMQSQKDYERQEQQKLLNKFYTMFET